MWTLFRDYGGSEVWVERPRVARERAGVVYDYELAAPGLWRVQNVSEIVAPFDGIYDIDICQRRRNLQAIPLPEFASGNERFDRVFRHRFASPEVAEKLRCNSLLLDELVSTAERYRADVRTLSIRPQGIHAPLRTWTRLLPRRRERIVRTLCAQLRVFAKDIRAFGCDQRAAADAAWTLLDSWGEAIRLGADEGVRDARWREFIAALERYEGTRTVVRERRP